MADAIPFQIRDDDGNPVTGAEGSFTRTAWNGQTGAPRSPAPIVAVPGAAGGYEASFSDADGVAAAVMLVDFGEGRNPRQLLFSVCKPDKTNQVIAVIFTDENGALWPGGGGTVAGWTGPTPPTVFKLASGAFVVRPTPGDIAADASGFIVPESGASPEDGYAIGVEPLGESPNTPLPPQPPTPVTPGQDSGLRVVGDLRLFVDKWLSADLAMMNNDLATDAGLETALILSLFTDRYDETIEDPTERRGYWADGLLIADDRMGSRLWSVDKKIGPATATQLRERSREATTWLIEDRVASSIEVTATPKTNGFELVVDVRRPNRNDTTRFRFARVWAAQEIR